MPSVHVHLHVADLARSRDFYRRFLGVEPVKNRADYVKFLPPQATLNLALTAGRVGHSGHFGLQLDSLEAVATELARVRAAGFTPRVEENVDC